MSDHRNRGAWDAAAERRTGLRIVAAAFLIVLAETGCGNRSEATKAALFEEAKIAVTESEKVDALERCLKRNPSLATASDSEGNTLLHHAAGGHQTGKLENQTVKFVELLVRYGADPDAENAEREHPLHRAASEGNKECMRALLQHKADVNAYQNMSRTPLHYAVDASLFSVEAAQTLLVGGADVNAEDSDGCRPLHLAIDKGNLELVRLLVAKGADVNAATHGHDNAETPCRKAVGAVGAGTHRPRHSRAPPVTRKPL